MKKALYSDYKDYPPLAKDGSLSNIINNQDLEFLFQNINFNDIDKRTIAKEYELLNIMTLKQNDPSRFISDEKVKTFNRYIAIPVFASSNVSLNPPNKYSPTTYVNANFIRNPYEPESAHPYFATQGPMHNTCIHFWKMVEIYQITHIVGIIEKKSIKSKCWNYWSPDCLENTYYSIIVKSETEGLLFDTRLLKITNNNSKNSFEVIHIHLHKWIDHQIISDNQIDEFLELLHKIYMMKNDNQNFKMAVHCSAGIGRTGTFYGSFFLYYQYSKSKMSKKEFAFSVFGLARYIREQRYYAIENLSQYEFLYKICAKLATVKNI